MENVKINDLSNSTHKNYYVLTCYILTIISYVSSVIYGSLWIFAIIDNKFGTNFAQCAFYQSTFMKFIIGFSYAICIFNIVLFLTLLILKKLKIKENKILSFLILFNVVVLAFVVFLSIVALGQTMSDFN